MPPTAKPPIQTAKTMKLDTVPKGLTPGEFLTDIDLAAMYKRELAALDADDPSRPALRVAYKAARKAAASTADAVADATEDV